MAVMNKVTELKHSMRWLIRRDMDEVIEIEHACFQWQDRWTEEMFLALLRQRNHIGVIITNGGEWDPVVGFMVYALHRDRYELHRFAVHKDHQRMGYGRLMVERMAGRLGDQRRTHVGVDVPERNVGTQLFLSRCGFRAVPAGDFVRMEYWI
jgi:ribosomal-protein-alanine N-acetyltransferase